MPARLGYSKELLDKLRVVLEMFEHFDGNDEVEGVVWKRDRVGQVGAVKGDPIDQEVLRKKVARFDSIASLGEDLAEIPFASAGIEDADIPVLREKR